MSNPTEIKLVSSNKCFEGFQQVYEHYSAELKCLMKFAAYIPQKSENEQLPVLIWLSGLTCNEQNFITKAGFQRLAQQHKIIVVCPDTSPRGCNIEGESDRWDFGVGAGFYVDATTEKWKTNFRMYSYVNNELHEVIRNNFTTNSNFSIFGHSMGGHGALMSFLKNPNKYKSASAFAPICNPCNCDWGKNAFQGYLGDDQNKWREYDSTELVRSYSGPQTTLLIDQGNDDKFLKESQLLPENLVASSGENKLVDVNLRTHDGYDHSYYFIATFIADHFEFHAKNLK